MLSDIQAITRTDAFTKAITNLLVEICEIDSTTNPDVSVMRQAEAACFDLIERELKASGYQGLNLVRQPVNPAIADHPAYSLLHFTKTKERPEGLSPEDTYRDRANLLATIPGAGNGSGNGDRLALNAHVDIVHPYFPPTVKNGKVYGRGTCDDKGQVISIVAALKVVRQLLDQWGLELQQPVTCMFVVEEETGGNGSLSLAIDSELGKTWDTIMVMECTDNVIHPANRGAVWYQANLALPEVNLFEMFAFVNEEMEKEGRAIRAESRHELFPQRPVQTCHGCIGSYGEHPSRICGHVAFRLELGTTPTDEAETKVVDVIEFALETYCGKYGDKTKVIDDETGEPKVDHHYDLRRDATGFVIEVHGSTGHMGAILENDGAITKMAHFVRGLFYSKAAIASAAGADQVTLSLEPMPDGGELLLEGGQGFVPTHPIEEVMDRFARSAERGADIYLRRIGHDANGKDAVNVSYDKLHNAAFDGDPDSTAMQNAMEAAEAVGLPCASQPIRGWTVSCDSRLFATEYPDRSVLTFGSGKLDHAHSDNEQLDLEEMRKAIETLVYWILKQTGTK